MFGVLALVLVFVTISYAVNHNTNCYIEGKTKDYNGNIRHTIEGRKCLNWAACPTYKIFTNGYRYLRDTDFPDGSINAASNYCRDPNSSGNLWCITSCDKFMSISFKCALNECNKDCYVKGQSKEYRGNLHKTVDGIECLDWKDFRGYKHTRDENFPDKSVEEASNYCRNPDASREPWCFIAGNRNDFCNVTVC